MPCIYTHYLYNIYTIVSSTLIFLLENGANRGLKPLDFFSIPPLIRRIRLPWVKRKNIYLRTIYKLKCNCIYKLTESNHFSLLEIYVLGLTSVSSMLPTEISLPVSVLAYKTGNGFLSSTRFVRRTVVSKKLDNFLINSYYFKLLQSFSTTGVLLIGGV